MQKSRIAFMQDLYCKILHKTSLKFGQTVQNFPENTYEETVMDPYTFQ